MCIMIKLYIYTYISLVGRRYVVDEMQSCVTISPFQDKTNDDVDLATCHFTPTCRIVHASKETVFLPFVSLTSRFAFLLR